MRFILLAGVVILGTFIGTTAIESVSKMQDSKMAQYCKIDPSYCTK